MTAISEQQNELDSVAAALRTRGFDARVTPDGAAARQLVAALVPSDAEVLTAPSETLRVTGIAADIDESGRFDAIRPELQKLDYHTEADARRRLAGVPEVIVGSVQAITRDGQVVLASATGSQLGPSAFGARRVIWVVGAQKIVPDLEAAFRRIEEHCLPLEDERARRLYGRGSLIGKRLIVEHEPVAGRITVVLVDEPLGY
jgi:YkgG family uncharacterized protein